MTKYTWGDTVCAKLDLHAGKYRGQQADIVGVCEDAQRGSYHSIFPAGTVYTIEFEDGTSADAHEKDLTLIPQ